MYAPTLTTILCTPKALFIADNDKVRNFQDYLHVTFDPKASVRIASHAQ